MRPPARAPATRAPFGQQLRRWRRHRGLSQLALALAAGTTPRYLSFLETGRSRPGAELVLRLAAALDLPLRERNGLLAAAGLAPRYPERPLADDGLAPVRGAVERLLEVHEPYPGWAISRAMQYVRANRAAERLLPGVCALTPEQVVDLWFGPGPLRSLVDNWAEVIPFTLDGLRRLAGELADPKVDRLVARAEAHLEGVALAGVPPDGAPVVSPRIRVGEQLIRTVTTTVRFDTATELTASELRLELVFPADAEAEAFFRAQAAG